MTAQRVTVTTAQVDLARPIRFTFDGKVCEGVSGDTLASALLANGYLRLARSFKYGRPRGIVGAGGEDPNVLVQLEDGPYTVPNLKATQVELYADLKAYSTSGWPSLNIDFKSMIGAGSRFMPAGFYNKTFKWPRKFWPAYESVIRKFAGFGRAPTQADPENYDHLHHHVDVLVVGGGASGLLAALHAGGAGMKTLLVDEQQRLGGWLLSDDTARIDDRDAQSFVRFMKDELAKMPHVTCLTRTNAFGLYQGDLMLAVESLQDHLALPVRDPKMPRQRQHKIRAAHVVLATGAIERPLVFGNNDLPGVMTVSAGQTFLQRYGVRVGKEVVVTGTSDAIYECANALARAGAKVHVADPRSSGMARTLEDGVMVHQGYAVSQAIGWGVVRAARLVKLDPNRDVAVSAGPTIRCDALLSSGGLSPTVHLFCHDGHYPIWREDLAAFVVPSGERESITCVGAVTGAFELGAALDQTTAAMRAAMARLGKSVELRSPRCDAAVRQPPRHLFRVPDGKSEAEGAKAFVDYQNDVTAADIELSIRENWRHIEHVKRFTALGFGTDQGKLSNVNGVAIAARALNVSIAQVGTTTYRPAYTPVSLGALAGNMQGKTFDPTRLTSIHPCHERRGAVLEPVGQWMRPWYFPITGEDMHAAVQRECRAARSGVAVMDASTLGKIQIDGPDAREFLNRVYTNAWSQLAPGKCRYGLMLDENGMVMDDGVTACISDTQFYMTTTTGGAARVFSWLERWHQTEWPDLKVWMTSVTDHWSTVAIVGPKSRDVLARLTENIDLDAKAFPFMDWRTGTVAGLAARVFRISFSGELAYEVNVESGYGQALWEAVMEVGKDFGITPYGTETMHILRAEKGFIIVGQDTDGSMTPNDLGMSWAVSQKKKYAFLGKRSLTRSDTVSVGRKVLVGLEPEDSNIVLPEGAQILEQATYTLPACMLGHVTSSYRSAERGRSIAMAVVRSGAQRQGQRLYAFVRGRVIPVKVVSSVFVDPKGERHHG